MTDITPYTNKIRNAIYGREVRDAIVSSLEKVNDDNNKYDALKTEVINARDEVNEMSIETREAIAKAEGLIRQAKNENADLTSLISDADDRQAELHSTIDSASEKYKEIQKAVQDALDATRNANQSATTAKSVADDTEQKAKAGDFDGATFTPTVSSDGNLSWTNNKGLVNPPAVNIRGPKGEIADLGNQVIGFQEATNNDPIVNTNNLITMFGKIKRLFTRVSSAETAITNLRSEIGKITYPVGSIYMSVNSTSPATLFGGTWQRIENRFLLAAGSSYSPGATGGFADAALVYHTHSVTGTAASAGAHTHGVSGSAASAGAHSHSMNNIWSNGSGSSSAYTQSSKRKLTTRSTASAGAHTHSVTGTAASAGAHAHGVTGTAAANGVTATGRNMPPYIAVYVWKRTA